MRNKYLKALLAEKGRDDDDTWSSISVNEGSVQHLDFLTEDEKDVFKTAFELDQRWVVEHAADRAPFICQAQSINVFLAADVHKRDLHQIHFQAWKKGVKSLYYCRSKSIQRAEAGAEHGADNKAADGVAAVPFAGRVNGGERPAAAQNTNDYEECLACQ